ncbi:uncharacterized protein A4U43_C07F8430 [Asparagus officinalis]|uniref:DNA polymerase n=1 Tax=Asparagus officinalis TaxID=4686 RepID=A0A5P1EAA5_ASPOF|nr:DNA polymerase lambda isoform X2 [Asparagus officinalis]ONK62816.1 uncharacterized protein A4U43_C07F8430 [Asparagus officinalis]
MAPKKRRCSPTPDTDGIFNGMVVFFVPKGIQQRRLQVWKQKLEQMGARVEDQLSKKVTHVFAADSNAIIQQVDHEHLKHFTGKLVLYQWLENCLKSGEKLSEEQYTLNLEVNNTEEQERVRNHKPTNPRYSGDELLRHKRTKVPSEDSREKGRIDDEKRAGLVPGGSDKPDNQEASKHVEEEMLEICHKTDQSICASSPSSVDSDPATFEASKEADASQLSSLYSPPDLNRNITEIFGKLINIYRALGDDRRSFSYHKAIAVIEKLPFKIESIDQVKHLPAIGKSMQDHIHEIVTTGRLSKLEHFEQDEKVRSVTLFGEVWGIGPATALKLYEKGHRTLEDLEKEDSLTNSQKLGLKYFDDISKRIPRNEVRDMEMLLQKAGEDILPGVVIVCGGSYRRGKPSCGDMDIVITHPDGESHKGFLSEYVRYLKEINFLREDLVFSVHSTEGTDSGVDTYFGLCTYPGRELRHRIDFKVYPRSIYAFGLIAWTGNDVLNRRLRLLAESKGYRLDDTGLFLATTSTSTKRGTKSSTSLNLRTEKEVFDFLGFPWLEPHERNL